jgi:hypothetical protein
VTLLFGDKLAGQTIFLRFRVGTDSAAGSDGWDIDNIAFTGLTNTPFPQWTVDPGSCDAVGTSSGESGAESGDSGGTSPGPTTSAGDEGTSAASSSSDTGDTAEQTGEDSGCGCMSRRPGALELTAPLLLLLGLRRRRHGSRGLDD